MKLTDRVTKTMRQIGAVLITAVCIGCVLDRTPNAHFGHGSFQCFYHNVHTGHLFLGKNDEKEKAARDAKNACKNNSRSDEEKMQCQFQECVFK